jgi:hypothetical protein
MTLDEIAYNILNAFRGGRSSQDEYISLYVETLLVMDLLLGT